MYICKPRFLFSKTHVPKFCFRQKSDQLKDDSKKDWADPHSQREFLEAIAKKLHIKEMKDWYNITHQDLLNMGARSLLKRHQNSHSILLSDLYPNYEWLPWKFDACPKHYWDNEKNQRKFLDYVSKEFKIKEMSDWYKITEKNLYELGGRGLLEKYNNSPALLVSTIFPEHEWLPWRFSQCPKHYWNEDANKRRYLGWAGKQLGIKEMSDWYKVSKQDLNNLDGSGLLQRYNSSVVSLISSVYTEYEWLPWRFEHSPRNFWRDPKNTRKFFDWAGKQLNIKELRDWETISEKEIAEIGGKSALRTTQYSLPKLLSIAYPHYGFKAKTAYSKKTQTILKSMLKTIFSQEVLEEYRHPDILTQSGHALEFDFYYPQLNLAIEYQGQQHYRNVNVFRTNSLEESKERDLSKLTLCKENGITLIEVPYWWDRKYESLEATIYTQRPDLFTIKPKGNPIPAVNPQQEDSQMTKSQNPSKKLLMTATEWDSESMDPSGWYMTEKYDGMRLYWNGSDFYSRQGNKVKVPESIKSRMPQAALDGELWTQYGLYQEAIMLSNSKDEEKWKKAVYWVFDAPDIADKPYEERMQHLQQMKEKEMFPSFVNIVQSVRCESKEHLKQYFDGIVAKGGEGVMLSQPQSLYKAGRSPSLRKYKPFYDTEVRVVENNYPHGFSCEQMNKKIIFVGLSDNYEEAKHVKKGTVITVKHLGTNVYGTLQYPKFYRERTDVKWSDLIKT